MYETDPWILLTIEFACSTTSLFIEEYWGYEDIILWYPMLQAGEGIHSNKINVPLKYSYNTYDYTNETDQLKIVFFWFSV